MRYLGGKARIAKHIVGVLNEYRRPGQMFVEPFVGAANIMCRMQGDRRAYDIHGDLIKMYQALQLGWVPPDELSEARYNALKTEKEEPHLKAFAGFGCSFGGKYFGGYARDNRGDDYCGAAKRALIRDIQKMQGVKFLRRHYQEIECSNALIYCDPPYAGTTGYSSGHFNSGGFWEWCRYMHAQRNTVIVSEYAAPPDFTCIWSTEVRLEMRSRNGREARVERLFTLTNKLKDENR